MWTLCNKFNLNIYTEKGRLGMTLKRGRRRRQLLDGVKERRGYSRLKKDVLDHTMWTVPFGRSVWGIIEKAGGRNQYVGQTGRAENCSGSNNINNKSCNA
jgi:hypothetical protein